MDEGGVLQGLEDALDRVFDGQDEAGGELLERTAGVAEGRGVGQETQGGDQVVEALLGAGDRCFRPICGHELRLGDGDVVGDAAEELVGVLDDFAAAVTDEVAAFEHDAGVFGELIDARASSWWRTATPSTRR